MPTAQSIRGNRGDFLGYSGPESRGIPNARQPPLLLSSAPEAGRRNRYPTVGARPSLPRPASGAGPKEKRQLGWLSRSHGSPSLTVGFIPPPHTGLGLPLDDGVSKGCRELAMQNVGDYTHPFESPWAIPCRPFGAPNRSRTPGERLRIPHAVTPPPNEEAATGWPPRHAQEVRRAGLHALRWHPERAPRRFHIRRTAD